MVLGGFFHGLLWSVLVLCSAKENPEILVQQPRGPINLQSGAVLALECKVTGRFEVGPVKWFKGEGASRELIFSSYAALDRLSRVSRKEEGSETDFTIFLRNVVPEDAGIYYCVKQRAEFEEGGKDLRSGQGTAVLVDEIVVQQPRGPLYAQSGAVLTLECKVTGRFEVGPVKWFKGEGASRELIFSSYTAFDTLSRVSRKVEGSETDFTIFLRNVVPEDAGIYYCVKQRAEFEGGGELLSGQGTAVLVDEILVQQPRGPINLQSGAVLTLECKVTGRFVVGSVRWFKGEGASRELIFSSYATLDRLSRVSRKEEDYKKDFTIFLHDVVPEDAGIYYCVKQRAVFEGGGDLLSGQGTEVLVDEVGCCGILAAGIAVCVLLVLFTSGAVYFCVKKRRGSSRSRHVSRPESPLPGNERTPSKDPNTQEIVYSIVEHSQKPRKSSRGIQNCTVNTQPSR